MAKTDKKPDKKFLLRLPDSYFEKVKKAADKNERSINSEIEYTIKEKYA